MQEGMFMIFFKRLRFVLDAWLTNTRTVAVRVTKLEQAFFGVRLSSWVLLVFNRTFERNLEKIFLNQTSYSSFFGWGILRRLRVSVPRKIWVVHRPPDKRIVAKYAMLALVLFWTLDEHMLAWDRVLTAEDTCRVTCAWVPPSFSRWSRQPRQPRLVHSTVPKVPVVFSG